MRTAAGVCCGVMSEVRTVHLKSRTFRVLESHMKNKLAKPDIALMSFAISVSKKAAVVATIKYGRVMVSNGDIDVELQFESQIDDFQIILVPEKNPFWKFSIPLTKLLKVDEIEAVLFTLLGVRRIPSEIKPIISIPYNYFKRIIDGGGIYLDCFFTPTNSEKFINYWVGIKKCKYYLNILINGQTKLSSEIYLVIRDGKGNEDL